MNVTTHPVGLASLDALEDVDALCVFVTEEERPLDGVAGYLDWRLCGRLSRLVVDGFVTGADGERVLLPSQGRIGAPRVFVFGLGEGSQLTEDRLREQLERSAVVLHRAGARRVALEVPKARLSEEALARAVSRGFLPSFNGERVALLAPEGMARWV